MKLTGICWLTTVERTVLTFWIGGLWITGYLVVPTLFSSLEDRQTAGQIAGSLFQTMNYIGLGAGIYLLTSLLMSASEKKISERIKMWRSWVLMIMLIIISLAAFIIQPMMQELKTQGLTEGSMQATQFGRLHGVSSVLFLINSLLGLVLVGAGIRPVSNSNS